jgi:hypothetical protein
MAEKLLRSQKNAIFKAVQEAKLSPYEFNWDEELGMGGSLAPRLVHQPSGYYFKIDLYLSDYWLSFSPGASKQSGSAKAKEWEAVMQFASQWLGFVAREVADPDLWGSLASEANLLRSTGDQESDNSTFSASERENIAKGLGEIKEYLLSMQNWTEEKQKIIEARFAYLEDASSRLGRKDWLGILISTLISVAIQVSLPGDSTREFLRFAGQIVRQVLGTVLYLPLPH